MAESPPAAHFRRDPLAYVDRVFPAAGDACWLGDGELLLAEPGAARWVLANPEGHYRDHSDFFHTRDGVFGPRSAQVAIGRAIRGLLRVHVSERRDALADAVARLPAATLWPDTGNWLVYRHLADALVAPDSPEELRRLVDEIVRRGVLAGAKERSARWRRALFRWRVDRRLGREMAARRRRGADPPADLVDAVASGAPAEAPPRILGEVYLSCVFAIAGSVGFTLGWCLYLLGRHPEADDAEPGWVVREALRLWPIAWMLGRQAARPHDLAGHRVAPADSVIVCPYLVHRHPRHWPEPERFLPERWAGGQRPEAFIPFGWGPHTCTAASLTLELVADVLRIVLDRHRPVVTVENPRPHVGPALAPPRFTLRLARRGQPRALERR